jgi:deoxyribodipyrimidine photo-lyase
VQLKRLDLSLTAVELIQQNFIGLYSGQVAVSSISGGQSAADLALKNLDISGYGQNRSNVMPKSSRGASILSPYIRHNLLTLKEVFTAVKGASFQDREKFRDELYWQEYARHLYARLGIRLFDDLRFSQHIQSSGTNWNRKLNCLDTMLRELEQDGWLVNQSRMWLASDWSIRNGQPWQSGQEIMFQNLLDGSRAANLLGWQWTAGTGTGKPYGFARWQVERRAPELCKECSLHGACPIQAFPEEHELTPLQSEPSLDRDLELDQSQGPLQPVKNAKPDFVLLTVDSLGDRDPAVSAHPDLPVVFVFNQAALHRLQLSSRRIAFYIQTLQDLASRREVFAYLGSPYQFAEEHKVAVTFAPVPSFRKFTRLSEIHPYPWLITPKSGSVRSYSSWRKSISN